MAHVLARVASVLLFLVFLSLASCSSESGEAPGDAHAPEVVEVDPPPSGPQRFDDIGNYTEEEEAAWQSAKHAGEVAIRLRDAGTGEPVAECDYYGFRFAFTKADTDRRLPIEVSRSGRPAATDGVHRFPLAEGWWRLRLAPDGYRTTWTPRFEIVREGTAELEMRLLRSNRLRVAVLDPDGRSLAKGVLMMRAPMLKATLTIRDGVGETLVDRDEIRLELDPRFDGMEGFRARSWPVTLAYGATTEVEVRLER